MPAINFSNDAEADIDGIAEYTKMSWGWRQADAYLDQLEETFDLLARNPSIGRACESIQPGLRRFEVGKHVIFYLSQTDGILVARILHQQMIPSKSRFQL